MVERFLLGSFINEVMIAGNNIATSLAETPFVNNMYEATKLLRTYMGVTALSEKQFAWACLFAFFMSISAFAKLIKLGWKAAEYDHVRGIAKIQSGAGRTIVHKDLGQIG